MTVLVNGAYLKLVGVFIVIQMNKMVKVTQMFVNRFHQALT